MRAFKLASVVLPTAVWLACGGEEPSAIAVPVKVKPAVASNAINHRPVIESLRLDPDNPIEGERVSVIARVRDPDSDPVEVGYEWWVAGSRLATGASTIMLENVERGDKIRVRALASDGDLESDSVSAEAVVRNQPPVLLGVGIRPEGKVLPGELVVATAHARDPDGDPLDYQFEWRVNGQPVRSDEPKLETSELKRGDRIRVTAIASDGSLTSEKIDSVVVEVANGHPRITSEPTVEWVDGSFHYEIEASDPDGDGSLRYALRQGPDGMQVDPVLGSVSWRPSSDQVGAHAIVIAVSDPLGATTLQEFEINVAWSEPESPPASSSR